MEEVCLRHKRDVTVDDPVPNQGRVPLQTPSATAAAMLSLEALSPTTWLLVGAAIFLAWWLLLRKPRGLPPGPMGRLPVLGHAHLLSPDLLGGLRKLRKQYGDVFHVYLGSRLAVVLNGHDVIRDVLVKHADQFTDRPHLPGLEEFGVGKGIITSSGDVWREHRRFALGALREFGFGRNILQEKIREEVSFLLDTVEEEKSQTFDISPCVHTAVSNVICNIVFGRRFQCTDPQFQRYLASMDFLVRNLGSQNTSRFSSFLTWLPGDLTGRGEAVRHLKVIKDELIQGAIQQHTKHFNPDVVNDYIDAYIKEMKARGAQRPDTAISVDQLWRVILDLFAAGTETTATTLRWALLYLLHYPDVQERLHTELQEKLGSGRLPVLEDRPELPFLDAFLLEVLRHADIVPLALPHSVASDVTYRGHVIPRGCLVIPNLHSVLRDPDVWEDPDVFRPDRFLQDGRVVKPEEFIPFSAGRRVCLGESLARMELFLFFSAMIQRFRFELPEGERLPDFEGILGVTYSPKPFKVRAILRE